MKAGSLVRWTNPEAPGLGVVVGRYENKSGTPVLDGHILVRWFDSFGSGVVPEDHEYLEVVSESR